MAESIGFVGGGRMAQALASGMVGAGVVENGKVHVFDPSEEAIAAFNHSVPGCVNSSSSVDVVSATDVVFLAVKPQVLPMVLEELAGNFQEHQLIVSVAAGFTIETIGKALGTSRVIRVMPNTPCLIGRGAMGFSADPSIDAATCQTMIGWLSSIGIVIEVRESLLDAVTGLSGSGPAYIFTLIESLADGGVMMGLSRDQALTLATQTVIGSAELVHQSGKHPSVLKDQVTSPGGTTIAGLHALEKRGFRASIIEAVKAAAERARELAGS